MTAPRRLTEGPWDEIRLFSRVDDYEAYRREALGEHTSHGLRDYLDGTRNLLDRYIGTLSCPRAMVREDFGRIWEDQGRDDLCDEPLSPDEAREVLSLWQEAKSGNRRRVHPLPPEPDRLFDLTLPSGALPDEVTPSA